jgi:hypothetical protein
MQAISQTKATSKMQVMPAPESIQDIDVFLISEALNKSQAIFDLLSSRKLEVFCLPDSNDESVGFLIDANDSCKRILD